jgi:hypothetical protein
MGGLALLVVVVVQAVMVELPLTAAQTGWARVALAVLMAGGTFGVWRVPNAPAETSTARHQLGE